MQDDIQCVGGQVIPNPKENDMEMPPKSSGRGPSISTVMLGESMEIPAGESELHRDGKLVAKDGTEVAKFDKNAYTRIEAKHNKENNKTTAKTTKKAAKSASKDDGR